MLLPQFHGLRKENKAPMVEILFEDNHVIVVKKPFGMPTQPDPSGDESVADWIKNYVKEKYNKPGNVYLGLVHRLDRVTGGILIFGRTSKAADRLSAQFRLRTVEKVYYAITEHIPEPMERTMVNYLTRVPEKNIMRAYNKEMVNSQRAELSYTVIQTRGERALLEVRPVTGRKHQIRVQLASIGAVIVGDVKYGKTTFNEDKSICLFAGKLSIEHPTSKQAMTFAVDLPKTGPWGDFSWEK